MKRLAFGLFVVLAQLGTGTLALAQSPSEGAAADPAPAADAPAEVSTDLPDLGDITETPATKDTAATPVSAQRSWEDIVVVPRKAFLKDLRVELAPFTGVSINDVLIRHYSIGGDLNFYLTDVFSIGLEGQYFIKERSSRESLIGLQFNRVTTLNRFKYHGAVNFGYAVGYGKFALLNKYIFHWDTTVSAGIGMIWTEIIPRVVGDEVFGSNNLAPHIGLSSRLFVRDWLTVSVSIRDYIFLDKFEPLARGTDPNNSGTKLYAKAADAKAHADSQLTNNVMVFFSVGFFLPPSFSYKTPR
jgi:outer membrane beta-barrel protein